VARQSAIAALLAVVVASVSAQSGYAALLTPADVEKVSGLTGVTLVARGAQPAAGGDLNFAGPDRKLLLMVNFGNAQLYRKAREQKEITVGGQTLPMPLFAHAVPDLGDEAFDAPPGKEQHVLYVRKGDKAISVTTYLGSQAQRFKPLLTQAQLRDIARVILSRW